MKAKLYRKARKAVLQRHIGEVLEEGDLGQSGHWNIQKLTVDAAPNEDMRTCSVKHDAKKDALGLAEETAHDLEHGPPSLFGASHSSPKVVAHRHCSC